MFRHGTLTVVVLAALATACASTGAIPQPFPRPMGSPPPLPVPAAPAARPGGTADVLPPIVSGYGLAGTALSLRGTPYRSGGHDPGGFDCSGLIWYVFAQHGVQMPRTVSEQFHVGAEIQSDQIEAGDLVFFSTEAPGASHVAMAIGGDEFVHAPNRRGEVRVERLSASYWSSRYIGARRIR